LFSSLRPPPSPTLFPYTTLFRSAFVQTSGFLYAFIIGFLLTAIPRFTGTEAPSRRVQYALASIVAISAIAFEFQFFVIGQTGFLDRKSTRLNSSHQIISYAVFCL